MIHDAEIERIVDIAVSAVMRRNYRARAFERGDLVNEGWVIALETLPRQQRRGAPMGPYLGQAIQWSLLDAISRWSSGWASNAGPSELPDVADGAPGPEALTMARASASRAMASLTPSDRAIVGRLLGTDGSRPQLPPEIARAAGVTVGRIYQARKMLARAAGVRRAREAA